MDLVVILWLVGVAVSKEKFNIFKEKILEFAKKFDISNLVPIIYIDDIIQVDELNRQMIEELNLLEPYGEANQTPIFAFKDLKIDSIRGLSEGKHLKLTLKSNKNTYISAIGFNLGEYLSELKIGDKVDIAGTLEINSYNGVDSIQIGIKDIMKSV